MTRFARTAAALATGILAMVAGLPATGGLATAEAAGVTHSYLVLAKTPAGTAAAQRAAVKAGAQVVQSWPQIGVVVVRSSRSGYLTTLKRVGGTAVLSAADARMGRAGESVPLGRSVSVASTTRRITAARTGVTASAASDPMTPGQTYLTTDRALAANRITAGSRSVVVGVLDTGVDDTHPDLARNFSAADSVDCTAGGRPNTAARAWRGRDSHGTHVAGTIAAARNGIGVTGVAPGVKVASVKVVNSAGLTYPEYLVCGYMWAAQRQLSVTNASINVFSLWCDQLGLRGPALLAVTRAVNYAAGRGVMNVSSAGNDGMDTSWQRGESCHDPIAENRGVVHVASVSQRGALSAFSSYGPGMVSIAAPGEGVLSSGASRGYELRSGTSQAAPQVAGTLALMKSLQPGWSSTRLVATMRSNAKAVSVRSLGADCFGTARANSCTGSGQLDTYAALRATR